MATFNIGDVVQLKSGGPFMTVIGVEELYDGLPSVLCKWFDDKGKTSQEYFPVQALTSA